MLGTGGKLGVLRHRHRVHAENPYGGQLFSRPSGRSATRIAATIHRGVVGIRRGLKRAQGGTQRRGASGQVRNFVITGSLQDGATIQRDRARILHVR